MPTQIRNDTQTEMKTKLIPLLALAAIFVLSACNTVAGIGEDVAGGARTVQSWF